MHHAGPKGQHYSPFARALILLALGLVYFGLLQHIYHTHDQEQHARLRYQLSSLSHSLEEVISARFYLLTELDSYVQTEPDIDQSRFQQITQETFNRQAGIRSLQLARNSVISHLSPLVGNQEALGYDLQGDAERRTQTQKAITQRQAILAGPLDLVQGGQGLAIRKPIFIYSQAEQTEQYWGLAIVLLDWGQVLKESDLSGISAEYEVALRRTDSEGQWLPAFHGEDQLFSSQKSELTALHLPSVIWQVALHPKLDSPYQLQLIGYAIGLLFLLTSAYLLLQLGHSQHQLAPSALALCFILLTLLMVGLDHLDRNSKQQVLLSQSLEAQNNRIRLRLLNHLHQLQGLTSRTSQRSLSPVEFKLSAHKRLEYYPEVESITWLDPDRRIRQQHTRLLKAIKKGEKIEALESQKAALKAQSLRQAVFTPAFKNDQNVFAFDLWLPIYRGNQLTGLFGLRINCQQLLEASTSQEFAQQYRLRLRNRGNQQYARLLDEKQQLTALRAMANLSPPGQGMALELTRYQATWPLLSLLLLALLLAMGGVTSINLQQLLKRQNRLVQRLQQESDQHLELKRECNLLQSTLQSIGEGVITTDADGLVYRINPIAERLCQSTQASARGKTLFTVMRLQGSGHIKPLQESLAHTLQKAQQRQQPQWMTGTLVDQNTERHNVRCTIAPIINGDAEFFGHVIIIHDLTSMQAKARQIEYRQNQEQHTPVTAEEFELCCKEALIHARETGFEHLLLFIDLVVTTPAETPELLQNLELALFRLLKQQVRILDPLALLSSHRFALLLRYCSTSKGQQLADKILEAVQKPGIFWAAPSEKPQIELNIGLVRLSHRCEDYGALTTQANMASYIAQGLGPNTCYQAPEEELPAFNNSPDDDANQTNAAKDSTDEQ